MTVIPPERKNVGGRPKQGNDRPLTPREERFVHYIGMGLNNVAEAARLAGYSEKSARSIGREVLGRGVVQLSIEKKIRSLQLPRAAKAARIVEQLADTARSEYVKLEAAKDMQDRAGLKAPDRHMHLHAGSLNVHIDLS